MSKERRYFIWDDGDGHNYCVPVELRDKIKQIDSLGSGECGGYDKYIEKWESLFAEIESQLISFEGILTFTDPKIK